MNRPSADPAFIRERMEMDERHCLSRFAAFSAASRGRQKPEAQCPVRTCYQRDLDRIAGCAHFRKLKDKTDAFIPTQGEKFRSVLTRTEWVARLARSVCRALSLNADLAEAIALGSSLGCAPFGRAGEHAIRDSGFKFRRQEQSLRVADFLENSGVGLNLTGEVRDGIFYASQAGFMDGISSTGRPPTLEAEAVVYCERISHASFELDDALDSGQIAPSDVPPQAEAALGMTRSARVCAMFRNLVESSAGRPMLKWENPVADAVEKLQVFLLGGDAAAQGSAGWGDARMVITGLMKYYSAHYEELLAAMPWANSAADVASGRDAGGGPDGACRRAAVDFIASMTDTQARDLFFRNCPAK